VLSLVLGGARSGKSRYAQGLCAGRELVVVVATARDDGDPEFRERILRHRRDRPETWQTLEEPLAVPEAIASLAPGAVALVDCVTLWLANLAWEERQRSRDQRAERVLARVDALAAAAAGRELVLVSNEVGGGIVPENAAAREFRDLQGLANQRLAAAADRVVLVTAGLPLPLRDTR
jgi:adenosylcobinamide kinase/adenosylcobinamide-phosphate guanylyltransferase